MCENLHEEPREHRPINQSMHKLGFRCTSTPLSVSAWDEREAMVCVDKSCCYHQYGCFPSEGSGILTEKIELSFED